MNPLVIPAGYQVQTESQIGEYFNALTMQTLEAQKKSRKISLPYTPEPPDPKDIPTTRNYTAN
jgi:hypothetical protein